MTTNAFAFEQTLTNKTKKDVLAGKILEMIFTGLLRDGDQLPSERELGNMFGVSRETVRSALAIVAAYGLISVAHGAKTRVNRNEELLKRCIELLPELGAIEVNNYDVHTVFDSRKVIEAAIARNAARNIDRVGLEALRKLLDQQQQLFNEPVHFQLSDKNFHKLISEYAGNEILLKYTEDLYSYGLNFRRLVMQMEGSIERSYREHEAIYSALEAHDPDRAEQAMLAHIESVYCTTVEAMQGNA
ncbi:Transcriptional regulator, GntR family [Marinobacterium lacunae]|uniref:Transcriptional regulator, GntR family n=2 Tax=Marinobacterium lacunae TaxID=1232683 RepID=A0A081FZJ8_9GAMM|nr:Transcriptional regulator, GntR family [Marinobacterium lacunae]